MGRPGDAPRRNPFEERGKSWVRFAAMPTLTLSIGADVIDRAHRAGVARMGLWTMDREVFREAERNALS
jgi:hypothetical protein